MLDRVLHSRYQVQQLLGKKTILARDRHTTQSVIIKLIPIPSIQTSEFIGQITSKINLLRQLSHPSLPKYLDNFEIESPQGRIIAIVRPYLSAQPLDAYFNSIQFLGEQELKEIAKYLLEILSYLHQQDVPLSHGNIKLSNILFDSQSSRFYLVDFALDSDSPTTDLQDLGKVLISLSTGIKYGYIPENFEQKTNLSAFFIYWLKRLSNPYQDYYFRSVTEALASLYSCQLILVSSGNLTKPYGSEVSVYKKDNLLQIKIASKTKQKFLNNIKTHLGQFLPSLVFTVILLTIVGIYDLKLVAFLIPIVLIVLLNLISSSFSWQLCKSFWKGELVLDITSKKVSLFQKLWGLKFKLTADAASSEIHSLLRRNVTVTMQGENLTIVPPCLALIANYREYIITASEDVSEAELDWLAQQLSDWLRLPITRM
jgi:serine/threonine protein kinase